MVKDNEIIKVSFEFSLMIIEYCEYWRKTENMLLQGNY
jgi:hypothetical protein